MSTRKITLLRTLLIVPYTLHSLYEDFLLRKQKGITFCAELPASLSALLESRARINGILFTGNPDHDSRVWVSMRNGDKFSSFIKEVREALDPTFIFAPHTTATQLRKDFLEQGVEADEYAKSGLQIMKLCAIWSDTESIRCAIVGEPVCVN